MKAPLTSVTFFIYVKLILFVILEQQFGAACRSLRNAQCKCMEVTRFLNLDKPYFLSSKWLMKWIALSIISIIQHFNRTVLSLITSIVKFFHFQCQTSIGKFFHFQRQSVPSFTWWHLSLVYYFSNITSLQFFKYN